ncbi:MAG: thioredoxin family protein [Chlorobi bacterium]|nr:thioredoxin family protein [Chlorobiota bacterium]
MYSSEPENVDSVVSAIQQEPALMLYFYNDHCAPCISLRPKVMELIRNEFPKVSLYFINSEKHPEIAAAYNSFSNPTLILFFDGKEFRRMSKYISIPQLAGEIARPYAMMFEEIGS